MTDKPLNCVGIDPAKQQTGSHDIRMRELLDQEAKRNRFEAWNNAADRLILELLERYFSESDTADSYQSYSVASPEGVLEVIRPFLRLPEQETVEPTAPDQKLVERVASAIMTRYSDHSDSYGVPDCVQGYARAAISAYRAEQPSWHSIETAPKNGSPILLRLDDNDLNCASWTSIGWFAGETFKALDSMGLRSATATHWMPLPPPPPLVGKPSGGDV